MLARYLWCCRICPDVYFKKYPVCSAQKMSWNVVKNICFLCQCLEIGMKYSQKQFSCVGTKMAEKGPDVLFFLEISSLVVTKTSGKLANVSSNLDHFFSPNVSANISSFVATIMVEKCPIVCSKICCRIATKIPQYPAVSRSRMLKRSLERWSLALWPFHLTVTSPLLPPVDRKVYISNLKPSLNMTHIVEVLLAYVRNAHIWHAVMMF